MPTESLTETRKLVNLEKTLGQYSVAATLCSYGDVLDFVESENPGVVLVDTLGHSKSKGKAMQDFLQREIASGWGREGSAEEAFVNLSVKLASLRQGKKKGESENWYDSVSGLYCQLRPEAVYLVSAGVLGYSLWRKSDSKEYQSFPFNFFGSLDDLSLGKNSPMHEIVLGNDDVLFLSSDGLGHNLARSFSKEAWFSAFSLHSLQLANLAIQCQLDNFHDRDTAGDIRDCLNENLSRYFLPKGREYDDVTFVVIKKRK